jgi:hypothetical protein
MNLRKKSTREEFERALARCKPEDFDGHTEFYRLTPEQRLEWLCQAAAFVHEFKGKHTLLPNARRRRLPDYLWRLS